MYLDLHSHHRPESRAREASINIYNLNRKELLSGDWTEASQQITVSGYYPVSAGIHPWDLPAGAGAKTAGTGNGQPGDLPENSLALEASLEQLRLAAQNPQVVLIGECGLDKLKGGDPTLQEQIFLSQAQIAAQYQKPMIIHCVRAFAELIALQKRHLPDIPMIIHGFNKSPQLADQLSQHGFMLSFGAPILRENSPAAASLIRQYRQGRPLFLETDDSDIPIAQIYSQAANLLEISPEALKDVIFASWKKIGLIHE